MGLLQELSARMNRHLHSLKIRDEKEQDLLDVLPRDAIMAIEDPVFSRIPDAIGQMADEEMLIGLELYKECRAYPINVLTLHQVVNDTFGELPIAVTW